MKPRSLVRSILVNLVDLGGGAGGRLPADLDGASPRSSRRRELFRIPPSFLPETITFEHYCDAPVADAVPALFRAIR